MHEPGTFRIVDKLQKFGIDIQPEQLRYHRRRVLVSKEFTFDAAHHLHHYEGKCKNLHGHTYKVVFGVSGLPDSTGMVLDFADLRRIWKERIEIYLDHQYLNETLPLMNTTAENIVVWLFEQMDSALSSPAYRDHILGGRTEFVKLYETPTSFAEARREWMLDA